MKGVRYFIRNFTATAVKEHLRSQFEDTGGRPELTPNEVELVGYLRTANASPALRVRFARHTDRLPELVAFYRDGLGLPELGRFEGARRLRQRLPRPAGHRRAPRVHERRAPRSSCAHPETLLVLYLGDQATVDEAVRRTDVEPVKATNPYWNAHGVTLADPDGFRVVLVPEPGPEA